MSVRLYVRVRGRVRGPFDEEKLRALAKRGQLSRIHELSEDGEHWTRAADNLDLFPPSSAIETKPLAAPTPASQPQVQSAVAANLEPDVRAWYYESKDGGSDGPIGTAELVQHLATGRIPSDRNVWCQEIGEWTPANTVPELASNAQTSFESSSYRTNTRGEIPPDVVRALGGSRLWVVFIAVIVFVYATMSLVIGGYFAVVGARKGVAPVTFYGVLTVVSGVLYMVGGVMLINHSIRIGRFIAQPRTERLVSALDALRAFWMYVSVLLIVALAFILFTLLAVFSTVWSLV